MNNYLSNDDCLLNWSKLCPESELCSMLNKIFPQIMIIRNIDNSVRLSRGMAELFFSIDESIVSNISMEQLLSHIHISSVDIFKNDLERVMLKREERKDCVLIIDKDGECDSIGVRLCGVNISGIGDCVIAIGYGNKELAAEYNETMDKVIDDLQQAQLINKLIVEGASDYIYQLDLRTNHCTFSPQAVDILPIDSASFDNGLETCLSFIVPEDRNIFLNSMADFMAGKSQYHMAEYRVMTRKGDIMWVSCRGKGIHDSNSNPLFIAGSLLDITDKKENEYYINEMAGIDALTELRNRYGFNSDMADVFENKDAKGAIIYIDIDDFKIFNDVFGHTFGNKVLIAIAKTIEMFFPKNLGVYRLNSDEYIVNVAEIDKDLIEQMIMPFLLELKRPRNIDGHIIYVTASIGVALYPDHGGTANEVLKNADIAMYSAKCEGKNSITFFLGSSTENISRRFALETELRTAIDNGFKNFYVVYQPIINSKTGKWIGAEALIRWDSPIYGAVSVQETIEVLEYTGLISEVGIWIMQTAVAECAKWHQMGFENAIININLSTIQMKDLYFGDELSGVLEKYDLPPRFAVIEVTETSLIHNMDFATEFCNGLRKIGVGIALDDFGTGYSSLRYLRELPLTEIKIDKSFLVDLQNDAYNRSLISTVCDLGHSINLSCCVEGVEEEFQWELLKGMNVDILQGYLFSKPISSELYRNLFKENM